MYGKPAMTYFNIRWTCMVQKPSHIWMLYFKWLHSLLYGSSDWTHLPPPPHYRQTSPPHGSITFTHLEENFSMANSPYLRESKVKTCMVKEPSQVKQLSLIHVCKIGLRFVITVGQIVSIWKLA
jgi:hypothetical protein